MPAFRVPQILTAFGRFQPTKIWLNYSSKLFSLNDFGTHCELGLIFRFRLHYFLTLDNDLAWTGGVGKPVA